MSWNVNMTGLEGITIWPEKLGGGVPKAVVKACRESADKLETEAREHVYDGITQRTNAISESIHAYCENKGNSVEFGIGTELDYAIYHEMGTGPVGDAAGYPGEPELDQPVSRVKEGWWYYDESAVGQPLPDTIQFGKHKGERREPPGQVSNGLIYTEGVKPQAFMYNAAQTLQDAIVETIAEAAGEVFEE